MEWYKQEPFQIMVLRWISNFRQKWKKRNFLWAIRWRRRSFSWAAHNGFYHALIPLYCSQALLMWSDKDIKKPSICFTAHFELNLTKVIFFCVQVGDQSQLTKYYRTSFCEISILFSFLDIIELEVKWII